MITCPVCGQSLHAVEPNIVTTYKCADGHYISLSDLLKHNKHKVKDGWEQYGLE